MFGVIALAIAMTWGTTQVAWTAVGAGIGVFCAAVWVVYTFPNDTGHSLEGALLDARDSFWIETTLTPIAFGAVGLAARLTKRILRRAA